MNVVQIIRDQPTRTGAIHSELAVSKGSAPSFALDRDSKTGRGMEDLKSGGKGQGAHVYPNWRSLV
jgi:hypothetical protein